MTCRCWTQWIGAIVGMSPCPAGVVVSAGVVDSFIWPKIISTKWLPECHYVLQVLNTTDVVDRYIYKFRAIARMSPCPAGVVVSEDVVNSFISPKIISTKWLPVCHYVLLVLNKTDVVDNFIWPKIISTKWLSEYHLDLWTWLNSANSSRYIHS